MFFSSVTNLLIISIYILDIATSRQQKTGEILDIHQENITPLITVSVAVDNEVQNDVDILGNKQEHIIEMITEQNEVGVQGNRQDNIEIITKSNDGENNIPINNYMELEKGFTKKGEIRKRKKYLVCKKDRKEFFLQKTIKCHEVKPPCKCKKECFKKINATIRQELNKKYWNKTFTEKKAFLGHYTETVNITKRRSSSSEHSRKQSTRKYFMKGDNGTGVEVCKVFFLTTLGYAGNNDAILRNIESPPKDKRGSYKRLKIDKEVIQKHIKKYSPCVSHYRREHAPHKLYLPSDITITSMFQDFQETHPNIMISYEFYRTVIKDMNISFAKLGHEECEKCEFFLLHDVNHSKENAETNNDCSICCQWLQHIRKAKESREEYRRDTQRTDEDTIYYSTDMQKVIMLPRLEMFKQVLFTPRIIAFNQSFVPLGNISVTSKAVAVLWHEAIAGRKKEDVTSAYYKFLTSYGRDNKNIILWADNCSGQNKNWCLLSFLIYIINSDHIAAETITIKYFEVGHTFMSADSFHHLVEKGLRENPKVYDFQDFTNVVQNITKNNGANVAKVMKCSDFKHWPNMTTNYQIQKLNKNRPLLKEIVTIEARRDSRSLFYKKCFKEVEYQELNILSKKNILFKEPECYTSNRGISAERKNKLLNNLSSICPKHKLCFWKNLSESNAADLISNIEDE